MVSAPGSTMDLLKLIALDNDDVEVISTHLQDAVLKIGDIVWRPAERRLVVGLNRFDWEAAIDAPPNFRRRRAALRLQVECLEAELADLGPTWTTAACPNHPLNA